MDFEKHRIFTFLSDNIYDSKRFCATMIDAGGLPLTVEDHEVLRIAKRQREILRPFSVEWINFFEGIASAHETYYHQSKLVNADISVLTYSIICTRAFSISLSVFSAEHLPSTH